MTEQQEKRLVACIDASPYAQSICDYTAWLANKMGAPVELLHNIDQQPQPAIYDLSGTIGLGSQQQLLEEIATVEEQRGRLLLRQGQLLLNAAKQQLQQAGIEDPILSHHHGTLNDTLMTIEQHTRLVIMGVRGENHEDNDQGIGSQLEGIIRAVHTPVLVVDGEFVEPSRIMLAYDGSEGADKALAMVMQSPIFKGTECHLINVSQDLQASHTLLEQAVTRFSAQEIKMIPVALSGDVGQQLCDYRREHDINLMVMGAYSHNRLRNWLLGSFTNKMLSSARVPLLLLR